MFNKWLKRIFQKRPPFVLVRITKAVDEPQTVAQGEIVEVLNSDDAQVGDPTVMKRTGKTVTVLNFNMSYLKPGEFYAGVCLAASDKLILLNQAGWREALTEDHET